MSESRHISAFKRIMMMMKHMPLNTLATRTHALKSRIRLCASTYAEHFKCVNRTFPFNISISFANAIAYISADAIFMALILLCHCARLSMIKGESCALDYTPTMAAAKKMRNGEKL
uniref:Uncharacterized protein n=1 Tax=Bactrocera latifrons TaxID=174628 RepID=A0A0K8VAV8_BACLA